MSALIIIITNQIQDILDQKIVNLEVVQVFGSETVVVNGRRVATGESAYVQGEPVEFRKLLKEVGELWTSTNPMMGEWKQFTVEEVAVENNS